MPYEDTRLPPKWRRIKKLLVSLAGTTPALIVFLTTGDPTATEAAGAVAAWVATNGGVFQANNEA